MLRWHCPAGASSLPEQAVQRRFGLRQAVEALLKSHEETNSFIDTPAHQAAAEMLLADNEFKANESVAHYSIISLLGEGEWGRSIWPKTPTYTDE